MEKVGVELDSSLASKQRFVNFEEARSERPELTEAEIVVSGGRGVKSKENFKLPNLSFP